jgi:hypothetical protein
MEQDDKYNLRYILTKNGGFSPQLLEDLTHHIDLLMKIEDMKRMCEYD